MSRRGLRLVQTPMAVTSAGELLVNAGYALGIDDVHAVLSALPKSAIVFLGVVVPRRAMAEVLKRIDDAAAEIAGTTRLSEIGFAQGASEDARSSGEQVSERLDRRLRPPQRPRGRRRGP